MFQDLEVEKKVVVSMVNGLGSVEIGKVVNLSERFVVVDFPHHGVREFYRNTGVSVRGEAAGKLLQEYDLAVKEVGTECPHCGIMQRNFFMACELLQGGKNFHCFYCNKLLWLDLDGNAKKVLPPNE